MNRRHLILAAALAGAAALVMFGDNQPSADNVVEAAPRRASAGPAQPGRGAGAAPAAATMRGAAGAKLPGKGDAAGADTAILRLIPRAELLGEGEEMGSEADLFRRPEWGPGGAAEKAAAASAAAAAAAAAAAGPPPEPPPPMAPPLPFSFLGKAREGNQWQVFLVQGDKVHVVAPGAVIAGTYRVDTVAPPVLTLTYLPLNQTQQLNIGASE